MTELEQALRQLQQIESFCIFCDRLPIPPVTLPPNPVRAAGLDPDIWHGLGLVGLWAALDAFTERRPGYSKSISLSNRLSRKLPANLERILKELEDMRHLYAHNFAGIADAQYFKPNRKRHCFQRNTTYHLRSGAYFDGRRLALTLEDLRFYIKHTRDILEYLDNIKMRGK